MSETVVNMHQAKTHLSQLVDRVLAGEEVTIARAGKPQAKIVPLDDRPRRVVKLGTMRGEVWMADDFDETPPGFEPYM